MFNLEKAGKIIAAISATIALLVSSTTLVEKFGWMEKPKKPILTWAPEHFSITSGSAYEEFKVIAAREKHRDDCLVEDFKIEVRDSEFITHLAIPSIARFSGPASHKIDKFGFTMSIKNPEKVSPGVATLVAHIEYKCPEGMVILNYPDHKNLTFLISQELK
jgi:hypothetical protein